jgi:hypothetical protein
MHMKRIEEKSRRRVTFSCPAPVAKEVFVAVRLTAGPAQGSPEEAALGLKAVKYLPPGVHEYRFVVDGTWVDDPACRTAGRIHTACENCVLQL